MNQYLDNITKRTAVKNILKVYNEAEPEMIENGMKWYFDAQIKAIELKARFGISKIQGAAIISALSPQKTWMQNIKLAFDNTRAYKNGSSLGGHFTTCINKVPQIMEVATVKEMLTILNAPKTQNFFLNILGDLSGVTIDRHAIKIALKGKEFKSLTENRYEFLVECYKAAAKKVGIEPAEMQAITWCQWRGSHE